MLARIASAALAVEGVIQDNSAPSDKFRLLAALMQTPQLFKRVLQFTALTICLIAVVRVTWPLVRDSQQRKLTHRLIAEMELEDASNSRIRLRQIASLGDVSIAALVDAAASKRADVALLARQIIEEKLGTWIATSEVDPNYQLGQPISLLARALASQVANLGPLGQQWSSNLTLELVDLADKLPAQEAASLLADCSAILEYVPAVGPRMRTLDAAQTLGDAPELPSTLGGQPNLDLLDIPSERAISSKPAPTALPMPEIEDYSSSPIKTPQEVLPPLSSRWTPDSSQSASPSSPPPKASSLEAVREIADGPSPIPAPASISAVIELPSPDEMESLIATLRNESNRRLLERLAAGDFYSSGQVRLVLRERGITEEELSLVDQLLSKDPTDRLRLVRDVKVLPARPARRWLRELLNDENAEVRLQALTALATTNDPELVGLAREMAVTDRDTRVSELAGRIMREAR